jgi:hypothetical protein
MLKKLNGYNIKRFFEWLQKIGYLQPYITKKRNGPLEVAWSSRVLSALPIDDLWQVYLQAKEEAAKPLDDDELKKLGIYNPFDAAFLPRKIG